ncbi:hypothetical protein Peur_028799 [Populus x canadensis]
MDFGKEHCVRRAGFVSAVAEEIYVAKYWQYRVPKVQANIRFCQDLFCCSSELLLRRGPDMSFWISWSLRLWPAVVCLFYPFLISHSPRA